jgi:hypothetical protein
MRVTLGTRLSLMVRVMFGTSNNLCFVGRQKCTSMELVGGFRDRSMRGTASSDRCVLVHELLEQRHWYSMTRLLSMVAYRNCSDAIVNGSEICGAYTHTHTHTRARSVLFNLALHYRNSVQVLVGMS